MDTNKIEEAGNLKLSNEPCGLSDYEPCFVIRKYFNNDDNVLVAFIFNDTYGNQIRTFGDSLQTNIVTFEDYQNFIKLVDEAFARLIFG